MKKTIFAVVLIVIVAGAGTPFFSGILMERVVKQSFNDINRIYADAGSGFSMEIQQYDRGFASSRIEWKLKLGALRKFYGIDEILFIDSADHGFAGIVSKTSLEKNRWFTDFVNNKLDGKNPLDITTEYKFSGDVESTFTLDGFSLKEGRDVIEMMPGRIFIATDKGIKNILSGMTWAGCSVPGKFLMNGLSLDSKMRRISTFIWDGDLSFAVKSIKADNSEKEFELSNLKCDSTVDYNREENSISFGVGYGADSIKSNKEHIENAFVRVGLNRIDAKGYEELMTLYSQMMNRILDDIDASGQAPEKLAGAVEKQMAGMGIQMAGTYERFLKKGLEIRISDLRAQLPQGEIEGDVALSLKKDMTIARFLPVMVQPSAVLDIFSLKSHIRLPSQLVGENQMLLSPAYPGMQTGLFLKDGDNLTHQAETRDGKLFLNGKEVLLN